MFFTPKSCYWLQLIKSSISQAPGCVNVMSAGSTNLFNIFWRAEIRTIRTHFSFSSLLTLRFTYPHPRLPQLIFLLSLAELALMLVRLHAQMHTQRLAGVNVDH